MKEQEQTTYVTVKEFSLIMYSWGFWKGLAVGIVIGLSIALIGLGYWLVLQ